MPEVEESFNDLKYLLGNMGIDILFAIDKGATNFETIKLFSGIPLSCIKGRVPVLMDLNLVVQTDDEYLLTNRGKDFKCKISSR